MRTATVRNPDKSYVTLEQNVCVACGKTFDTNALLMDMKLRDTFDRHTVTGWGRCPDCEAKIKEGYIILVECDPSKSGYARPGSHIKPEDAYRTGTIIYMKREAAKRIFTGIEPQDINFIDPEATKKLQSMMPKEEKENKDESAS